MGEGKWRNGLDAGFAVNCVMVLTLSVIGVAMDRQPSYTSDMWLKDKIILARMLNAKKYTKAAEFLEAVCKVVNQGPILNQCQGMLFVLDLLKKGE